MEDNVLNYGLLNPSLGESATGRVIGASLLTVILIILAIAIWIDTGKDVRKED